MRRYAANAPDVALAQVAPDEDVGPALVRFFRELCRQRAGDPEGRGCLVCNAVAELVGVDDEVGPTLSAAIEAKRQLLGRLLRQAVRRGEIPAESGRPAAAGELMALLMGVNLLAKVVHDEAELWRTCRAFLRRLGFAVR